MQAAKQFLARLNFPWVAIFCSAMLILLYLIRPIGLIHGTVMFFYKYPLLWKLPLLVFIFSLVLFVWLPYFLWRKKKIIAKKQDVQKRLSEVQQNRGYGYSGGDRPWELNKQLRKLNNWYQTPVYVSLAFAFIALVFAASTVSMFTGRAIYEHYKFLDIPQLPANGKARILPKAVAEQLATSGYNSPTSKLAQAHIVLDADGNISWSFGEVPNGTWRKYTAKTQGVAVLNAESTARHMKLTEQDFDVSTDVRWTDNIKWQAYKKHFFTDVAETIYLVTASGEPVIIAPYLKYVGFWVKVPELAGVYVVHPNGDMEDLSPEEASHRSFIVQSGRMFPESLARRIQESYQYKGGILNRLFSHKEQTQISDTESNQQPYLMDFGAEGTKWVSTAQPYGKSQATNAIFLTDTVTGETDVWHVGDNQSYTGNSKALDIVRGLSIPGVTFASPDASDSAGKFEAVEPRPVIINGQLQFMISVIPNSETTVTKTVIVDAQSNKAVAVFNHDTDPQADEKLKQYLQTGALPSATDNEQHTISGENTPAGDKTPNVPADVPGAAGNISDQQLQDIIDRLLKANQDQEQAILELQQQLAEGH